MSSPTQQNIMMQQLPVIDITQYWRTIKRAKWSIVLITMLFLFVGLFIAKSATPIYKASANILADPQQPNAGGNEKAISSALVYLFYQTQYEIIKSRKIAETVVDKLNLVERYKQEQSQKQNNLKPSIFSRLTSATKSTFNSFIDKKDIKKTALTDEQIKVKIASYIQKNVKVTGGKQSQIIHLSYSSPNPKEATAIINAIAEAYIEFGLTSRLEEVKSTELWLGEQSSLLQKTLQESEQKLSEYRIQQGLVDTNQQKQLVNTQLQSLNKELINAQTKLSLAEEKYLSVQSLKQDTKALYSTSSVMQNQAINDMVKEQSKLQTKVNELFERYGEKHPKMIAARSELKSASLSLQQELEKVVENIEKNYRLAQFQVNNIEKLIDKSRNNIQLLQTESFTLVSLEREVENNRRIFENFQISLMEASGNSKYNASNVQIIDKAIVPKLPFKPNKKLIVVLATLFGLFFSIFLSFVREALKNTFKTPDTIEEKLNISNLGIIPIVKKSKNTAAPEQQYLQDSRSPFAESINTIRTGLLFSNIDQPPKTLLVTSATGSEGKTTTAINLATAFSYLGKTLLLEVDLRKPSIAKNFNIEQKLGLSDLVTGNTTSIEDIVHKENNEQLSMITCGTIPNNPLELLSSDKFKATLASLSEHYEYIILDGPPTLPVSDSCILANYVDGVIFAVKTEDTRIKVAKEALTRLQKLNANVIGAILTVAKPNKMGYYGDHYYSGEYYGITPEKEQ